MRKNLHLLLPLLLTALSTFGQDISLNVVAAGGGTVMNKGKMSLSWTLGENYTHTALQGGFHLTGGFQQGQLALDPKVSPPASEEDATLADPEYHNSEVDLQLFPNPTSDILTLRFPKPYAEALTITIYNSDRQVMIQQALPATTEEIAIPSVSTLPAGMYLLQIHDEQTPISSSLFVKS